MKLLRLQGTLGKQGPGNAGRVTGGKPLGKTKHRLATKRGRTGVGRGNGAESRNSVEGGARHPKAKLGPRE